MTQQSMREVLDKLRENSEAAVNRRLLEWLSNDTDRASLYAEFSANPAPIRFESPADTRESIYDTAEPTYKQKVFLLADKAHVLEALKNSASYSNSPFHALGGGNFMLGIDQDPRLGADDPHGKQRTFAQAHLALDPQDMLALVTVAFQAGALLSLKQRKFDLAELAAEVAVRYIGFMFGFAQSDHALIEQSMRKAYRGLCYQVMGRHFVSEPTTIAEANAAMAVLLKRTAELIGIYQSEAEHADRQDLLCQRCHRPGHTDGIGCAQADQARVLARELEELRRFVPPGKPVSAAPPAKPKASTPAPDATPRSESQPLEHFTPLLREIAKRARQDFTNTEAAVLVVGLIAGAIGNIQASVCIAVQHFFQLKDGKQLGDVITRARKARVASHSASPDADADADFAPCVREALRRNPPVAFLPRRARRALQVGGVTIDEGAVLLLGIGGATRLATDSADYTVPPIDLSSASKATPDPTGCPFHAATAPVFGGGNGFLHSCIGAHLAMPLIVYTVRQVMALPGLAEACDPRTGWPSGLRKLWGYGCESYPMEFRREVLMVQSPLSVIMKIKSPTAEHAEKLKLVIKHGAPSIEKKLKDARHVHFASFQFLENDTKLALFTVFDRDFDSYIAHFAEQIGPLFDKIFEHIVDAPPLPVDEFPREFVETIRRYNLPPAAGYFFSAHPTATAAQLSSAFEKAYW